MYIVRGRGSLATTSICLRMYSVTATYGSHTLFSIAINCSFFWKGKSSSLKEGPVCLRIAVFSFFLSAVIWLPGMPLSFDYIGIESRTHLLLR
jgi:hypothetical protein